MGWKRGAAVQGPFGGGLVEVVDRIEERTSLALQVQEVLEDGRLLRVLRAMEGLATSEAMAALWVESIPHTVRKLTQSAEEVKLKPRMQTR